jgi:hypothetical protein
MVASIVNEVAEFAHGASVGVCLSCCSKVFREVSRGDIEFLSGIQIRVGGRLLKESTRRGVRKDKPTIA